MRPFGLLFFGTVGVLQVLRDQTLQIGTIVPDSALARRRPLRPTGRLVPYFSPVGLKGASLLPGWPGVLSGALSGERQ
jgi:hypothetical protein